MEQNQNSAPATHPAPATGGKKNTGMAVIAYIIFFVPLLTGDAQKDPFVKFHVKQGLALFLLAVAISIVGRIMPFYIWWSIAWLLNLGTLVLFVIGIINAANGEQKLLPVIGKAAAWFKF
jgi:uncharacterized membrane protein